MDGFFHHISSPWQHRDDLLQQAHGNPDDVDGSNNTLYSGEQKAVCFFLKGGEGKIELKKLNTAFSKIQNNYCSVGKRQCDKAESMER